MKTALLLIGCIAVLVGLLWIGQGTGFVRWPASSFMIDEKQWAWYGLALATVGGGLIAHSRVSPNGDLTSIALPGSSIHTFITVTILLTVLAQGLFLVNFLWSLFRGERVLETNPWRATTLEWSVSSPPPAGDFGSTDPVVYRGAYEFSVPDAAEDFVPQHLAPGQVVKARKAGE